MNPATVSTGDGSLVAVGTIGLKRLLGRMMCHIVMFLVLLSALLKVVDLPAFLRALDTWTLVPEPLALPVSLIVSLAELGVALAWFVGLGGRLPLLIGAFGLLTATLFFAIHLVVAEAPDCGCFGVLLRHQRWLNDAWFVIGRNAGMLAFLILGALFAGPRHDAHRRAVGPSHSA